MKKTLIGLSALALGLAGAAYAQDAMPGGDPLGDKTMTKAEFLAKGAAMFDKMDANHDGKLDQADRAAHEAAMGGDAKGGDRAKHDGAMFDRIDTNHDGSISRDEFTAAHKRGPGGEGPDGGKHRGGHGGGRMGMAMMQMADANKDGAVSREEFAAAQAKHFDMMDTNHDGQVTKEERKAARGAMKGMHGMRHGADGPMGDMPPPPPAN
ncbi:MAG: EF-hand domain-containing protein [Novosphingobium sp.]